MIRKLSDSELIPLILKGRSSIEIAQEVGYSFRTIQARVSKLRGRYECRTIIELVVCLVGEKEWYDFLLRESKEGISFDSLTKRETETLKFVLMGENSASIATQLKISIRTVENFRSSITKKIGGATAANWVSFAIRLGLLFVFPSRFISEPFFETNQNKFKPMLYVDKLNKFYFDYSPEMGVSRIEALMVALKFSNVNVYSISRILSLTSMTVNKSLEEIQNQRNIDTSVAFVKVFIEIGGLKIKSIGNGELISKPQITEKYTNIVQALYSDGTSLRAHVTEGDRSPEGFIIKKIREQHL